MYLKWCVLHHSYNEKVIRLCNIVVNRHLRVYFVSLPYTKLLKHCNISLLNICFIVKTIFFSEHLIALISLISTFITHFNCTIKNVIFQRASLKIFLNVILCPKNCLTFTQSRPLQKYKIKLPSVKLHHILLILKE